MTDLICSDNEKKGKPAPPEGQLTSTPTCLNASECSNTSVFCCLHHQTFDPHDRDR